jgi:tRNA-dihydrouridine synthase A
VIQVTNAPFRHLCRILNRNAILYTEMVVDRSVCSNPKKYLTRSPGDSPIVAQLGGSDADLLSRTAEHCQEAGYDEINLNMGCPSTSVQSGGFGAALMLDQTITDSVRSMIAAVDIPISIKCRIGVDDHDSPAFLTDFIERMTSSGVRKFIIHARKALLGCNPLENRRIPPLNYAAVYRVVREFPDLHVVINGGIGSIEGAREQNKKVDGVMIGRAIRDNPFLLWQLQGPGGVHDRIDCAIKYGLYAGEEEAAGSHPTRVLLNPLMNLFAWTPISSLWKRALNMAKTDERSVDTVIQQAVDQVRFGMMDTERIQSNKPKLINKLICICNDYPSLEPYWNQPEQSLFLQSCSLFPQWYPLTSRTLQADRKDRWQDLGARLMKI